jgi:hypothetical protein
MDVGAQAAVGAGDDVFSADDFSERDAAIGYQFPVLDQTGGVAGLRGLYKEMVVVRHQTISVADAAVTGDDLRERV